MLELREGRGLYGMSHTDDDHDYRSSENPLFLLGDGNNSSSSSRLIVNHDYSDSPSLMTGRRNNNNISFSSRFSQATTATTTTASIDQFTGDHNQRIIEFATAPSPRRSHNKHNDDDESDGDTSPPLWKNTSTNRSPTATTTPSITEKFPWQTTRRPYYNYQFRSPLTTTTTTASHRSQEIARGRQELMEMIRSMPENSYELSLKDLIEKPTVDDHRQETTADERESNSTNNNSNSISRTTLISSREVKNENKARMLQRSKSVDSSNNGPFLLKMFLPFSGFGSNKNKKKSLKKGSTNLYAKVSPKPAPPLMEGDHKGTTAVDKEWWKKQFSVAGGDHTNTTTETNGGMESIGESSGGSSNSSGRSRKMGGFLNGCWSIGYTKKTKTMALKGSDF